MTGNGDVLPLFEFGGTAADSDTTPAASVLTDGDGEFCGCQVPRPQDLSHIEPAPHPAKYSAGIVETMAQMLADPAHHGCVLDPFAGTGRIRALEQLGPWCVHAVELEAEWAVHDPFTWLGDACRLPFRDHRFAVVATSPTYGNGMGQRRFHPNRSPHGSRHSYPDKLGRDMTPGSTGAVRWGREYRALHEAAWAEAVRVLQPGGRMLVNFRDSLKKQPDGWHATLPISGWHLATLTGLGLRFVAAAAVGTSGMRAGSNRNQLGTGEVIYAFDKPETVDTLEAPSSPAGLTAAA